VVLCSGGTEAVALGVAGMARRARAAAPGRTRVLVGAAEHPCVLGAAEALATDGFTIERLAVDAGARLRLDEAVARLDDRVALCALQAANHETGVLQPVAELAAQARSRGIHVLCDAVQAAGRLPLSLSALGADALALSSGKLYGPPGAGALVLGRGVDLVAAASGHQERGRRPGTEPLTAIVGFGAAAAEAGARLEADAAAQHLLRARLETGLCALGALVFAADAPRLPNTTLCASSGASGQLVVMALDLAGFAASTGAACSSGSVEPSAVLLAAGHARARAAEAVRFSLGRDTTTDDIDALLAALPPILARVRAAGGS
jgi:cysteine desulfurase